MKIFRLITEIFGWIQIVASPFLIALIVAFVVYYFNQDEAGLIISIVIALAGLITGIILATKIWKKKGTVNFISRINGTPQPDNNEE